MSTQIWRDNNQDKMREYRRDYYNRNKESEKARITKRKKDISAWFQDFKSSLKCTSCGEDHVACLDFHHEYDKEFDISAAVGTGLGIDTIKKEIEKCTVLCANCHRKHHYMQLKADKNKTDVC
jgi:transcription elongation factor Elf1